MSKRPDIEAASGTQESAAPFSQPVVLQPTPPALSARARAREKALANPAFADRRWKPGQSGNPQGAIGEWQRCRSLCREHSAQAAEEIIRLFSESDDDRVRYMAASAILERAWGKPREFDPHAEAAKPPLDLSLFTVEQQALFRKLLEIALAGPQPTQPDETSG